MAPKISTNENKWKWKRDCNEGKWRDFCRHEDGWIDCVTAPNVILQIEFLFHPMPLPGPPPQADVPTPEKEKQVMHDCSINLFDFYDTQLLDSRNI